jgi:hypothetical protein
MRRLIILPITLLLSGCPGGNPISKQRSVFMQENVICFSVNRSDVLNYYTISYEPERKYTVLYVAEGIHRSYPDTCIQIRLRNGYKYDIQYGLNGKKYSDGFFIDNDGNR